MTVQGFTAKEVKENKCKTMEKMHKIGKCEEELQARTIRWGVKKSKSRMKLSRSCKRVKLSLIKNRLKGRSFWG